MTRSASWVSAGGVIERGDLAELGGQVALVTAAGRGMGRGIAESLAEAGASLVINSYSESTVKETAQRCEAKGARVEVCIGDITDRNKMI